MAGRPEPGHDDGHGGWRRTATQDRDLSEDLARAALTLARRFAGGATMWCVAPTWPSHGRHVAVEFVHPVIVGKRALPAVSVDGAEAEGSLRLLARPGDILLVASTADDVGALDLLTRSEAWGLDADLDRSRTAPDGEPGGPRHLDGRSRPRPGRPLG